jgi:hypothetical protein
VPRKCKATFRNTNLPIPHLITSFACGSRTRGSPLLTAFGRMTGLQLDPTSEFPALVSTVESRMGAVAWAMRQRSVSHPRSSNRTCRFPASGSPTGFTVRHTEQLLTASPDQRGLGDFVDSLERRGVSSSLRLGIHRYTGECNHRPSGSQPSCADNSPRFRLLASKAPLAISLRNSDGDLVSNSQ